MTGSKKPTESPRRVVIFSGTTEGRELAAALANAGVGCVVCVATEYGTQTTPTHALVTTRQGRMDAEQMRALYRETSPDAVVDATHPYAQIVSATIRESLKGYDVAIPYLRLERGEGRRGAEDAPRRYADAAECAAALLETSGPVFLTTGSKDLAVFCADPKLRERLIVRVLPNMESLRLCYDAGLQGKQIIAAHGPFTKETNLAAMRQYSVAHMVTKESGTTGGEDAKLQAAAEAGVTLHLLRRPDAPCADVYSARGTITKLQELLNLPIPEPQTDVALVGIGCGANDLMTVAAAKRVAESDYVFGAPRMLDAVRGDAVKLPFYTKDKILPELARIREEHGGGKRVTVLFSGDVGFYSGFAKLYDALRGDPALHVSVLPGISSVTLLAARLGVSWQDAGFVSLHGVEASVWRGELLESVRGREKTFFLTSRGADMLDVARLLKDSPAAAGTTKLVVGRNLSYPDETLQVFTPDELLDADVTLFPDEDRGLYVGAIMQSAPQRRLLTPILDDDAFVRGAVPMTKEEIRKLAVCKLNLRAGDVVYDVGAGTGSVAVQIAALSPDVTVCAIERKAEGAALIRRNAAAYAWGNVQVVEGYAPDVFDGLPTPTSAFIGGSAGRLMEIVGALKAGNPRARVVITAVSMETIAEANAVLAAFRTTDADIVQVSAARVNKLGGYHMLQANNPVFIYSFTLDPDSDAAPGPGSGE